MSDKISDLEAAVGEFLTLNRIAVAGVSRTTGEAANVVYCRLRTAGYDVFAVNPAATEVEGDPCYPDIASIPGGVEGVVVVTPPEVVVDVVEECRVGGVGHVWMHRAFGAGSVSGDAVDRCREAGITVIPGGCPMMFCEPVDLGHRCIRWFLKVTGKLPAGASATRKAA